MVDKTLCVIQLYINNNFNKGVIVQIIQTKLNFYAALDNIQSHTKNLKQFPQLSLFRKLLSTLADLCSECHEFHTTRYVWEDKT